MKSHLHRLVFCLVLCLSVKLSLAATDLPYKTPHLSVEARIQDLLSRMTLDEKVAQLNLWPNLAELLKHKSIADDIALTLPQITNGVGGH